MTVHGGVGSVTRFYMERRWSGSGRIARRSARRHYTGAVFIRRRVWFGLISVPLLWTADDNSAIASKAVSVLNRQCASCHSGGVQFSGLDVSTREGLLKSGVRGATVKPGDSTASLLLRAVRRSDPKLSMPPAQPLAAADVDALKAWIDAGAVWPSAQQQSAGPSVPRWWSFHAPVRPAVPRSGDAWVRNEIDEFVVARLAAEKLRPAPEAKRAALIRRLSYDLTGLPPTAEQVEKFVGDVSPNVWESLIDSFLESPRYGERWGRHWLDLVRYSDTAGFEIDLYIPDAWRYRDYVIESFNKDKPYDRFIREQLAGEDFFTEDPVANTGTGYFCVGPNLDLYPDQADVNRVQILADYVDTTSSVFLGLTAGCARCHDHKFDPIPQRDYYRLQAVFAPAVKVKVALDRLSSLGHEVSENVREIQLREIGEQIGAVQGRCRKALLDAKLAALPAEAAEALRLTDSRRTPRQRELATQFGRRVSVSDRDVRACLDAGESERLQSIERRLVSMFAGYRSKPFACGVTDVGDFAPITYVPGRGTAKGPAVPPGVFSALGGGDFPEQNTFEHPVTGPIPLTSTTGRRHALASWLTRLDHPLTARVMVNRIWQYHFGRGTVATPSDFGTRGRAPSHPELLDWLATEFVAQGWSVKKLHKRILMSATWRQSADAAPAAKAKDPENLLLAHYSRRRLDADEVRDPVLAATGALKLQMGGRPVVPPLSKEELFNMIGRADSSWVVTADAAQHNRRGIYLLQKRTFRLPMMETFDAPAGQHGDLPAARFVHHGAPIADAAQRLVRGNAGAGDGGFHRHVRRGIPPHPAARARTGGTLERHSVS